MGALESVLALDGAAPIPDERLPPKASRSGQNRSHKSICTDAFFIDRIVEATGLPQGKAIVVYHLLLDAMKHALRRHREAVRIRGFGTLERVTRQGHKIRHPRTGEATVSRSFNYVRFRAAPTLKQTIRGHESKSRLEN